MSSSSLRRVLLPIGCAFLAVATTLFAENTAIRPEPRLTNAKWKAKHESFLELARQGGIDVLFLGDSITDFWRSEDKTKGGKAIWDRHFAPLRAANFGVSGDRTQNVLWRLQHGELEGIRPKVVVLMIGTNNTGVERNNDRPRNTPAEAIVGITAVVRTLRAKLPDSKILLLAIFPRGERPDHPQRAQIAEINSAIRKLDDGRFVRFLDIGARFLAEDGTLSAEAMPDFLHPSEKGYEIWAAAIQEPLLELMK